MKPDSSMPDMRVFEWLGFDSKQVPYYLHPLNLVWSNEGVDYDLQLYRRVAGLLAADTDYWHSIIRESDWRYSLAGCVCLLTSQRYEFFADLCYRFEMGSFVVPQISVTIGLLHGMEATRYFASVLESQTLRHSPKQAVSAHRMLLCLGVQPAYDISIDAWTGFERDDAFIADKAVAEHWDFWSKQVLPYSPS